MNCTGFRTVAICLVLAMSAHDPARAAGDAPVPGTAEVPKRPRIGLVLGGGGAKGAAHVGVLRVLEELHIPIDCIVGTSMGALVGGIYATSVDAVDLETSVSRISWSETIGLTSRRERLPMRRKLSGVTFSNNLEFGVRDGGLVAQTGLINTQNIQQNIQFLTRRGLGAHSFDELPIPFRAIATDMQSGDMVVLSEGDLAVALRASMAVPGAFSPVSLDGRILGDGGLVRNLGVDVARQLCADVVIAVAMPTPVPTAAELSSPLTLVARTMDVMIGNNEREQLATLGPDDVAIVINMGDIGTASFPRIPDAIPIGRLAAETQRASLSRYSLPAAEYRAWQDSRHSETVGEVRLAAVNIRGGSNVNPEFIERKLGLQPGDEVTSQQIGARIDAVFALDDFDSIDYRISGEPDASTLDIALSEKSWGPNLLRFDFGLFLETGANNAFTLGADYMRPWVNARGGELHGSLRIGRTSGLAGSLYQPLDARHVWFVEPSLELQRSVEDIYDDGDAIARYELDAAIASFEFGRVIGTRGDLRFGLQSGGQSAQRDIAITEFQDLDWEGYGGWTARYVYDSRDRELLATRGTLARVRYFRSEEALGAVSEYDRLEGMILISQAIGRNMLYLRAAGGTSFDTELPIYDTFTLGGPVSFPGLGLGELRGDEYWAAGATYMYKVADLMSLFGQALYLGFGLGAGDMSKRLDSVREDPIYSGSLILGGRTPLGPMALMLAATTNSRWQLSFTLGRPVEERTISDPAW